MYLDVNNLYGWAISQKPPVNGFKLVEDLSELNESFIKGFYEYLKKLLSLHRNLPFLPERNKIKKCNKLACNIQDKENYVVHIRTLKQALNHGLIHGSWIKSAQSNSI